MSRHPLIINSRLKAHQSPDPENFIEEVVEAVEPEEVKLTEVPLEEVSFTTDILKDLEEPLKKLTKKKGSSNE